MAFLRGTGTTTEPQSYSFTDKPAPGLGYSYRIKQVDYDGKYSCSKEENVFLPAMDVIVLEPNYSNPFSSSTTLNYLVPREGRYTVSVMNVNVEEVKIFSNGIHSPGRHTVVWNSGGVSQGVYYFIVRGEGYRAGIKMLLMR